MSDNGLKRRYFINSLKYLVVLRRWGNGFSITTAYYITEQWEKDRIRRQMGI
jgi:hypothetical protein